MAVADVRVRYDRRDALRVGALAISRAEVLAIIGPNGSGKSTLLRVLGLLERPTEGEVHFHGRPVDARNALAQRRRMAMVFQQPLLADLSVADNVGLGLAFRGVPPAERRPRVAHWLERFAIAPLADRRARTLSGGEAQRVALARALVLEPEVLLLDEPFAALDEPSRTALIPDLGAILRADRVTTVLVSHDRAEALALADRVAVLIGGIVQQVGTTAQVFQAPVSEEVARFVGVETIVDGDVVTVEAGVALVDVAGRKLEVAGAALPGERVRVAIRPEDVTLAQPLSVPTLTSARNHLTGTVMRVTPGRPVRVLVDCGFPLVAAVTGRSVDELGLAPGVAVTAIFKASAAHLIRAGASLDTPTRPGL
jgi:tungstate transport system ATP-binding protein